MSFSKKHKVLTWEMSQGAELGIEVVASAIKDMDTAWDEWLFRR
jgi:hypothetical protein